MDIQGKKLYESDRLRSVTDTFGFFELKGGDIRQNNRKINFNHYWNY